MRILVTGGAGFIGSHLCEELVKEHEVVSIDDYSTGTENNHIEGVTYFKMPTQLINLSLTFKPDIVYHLGEYSRVEQSFDDIDKVWESNKTGTFEVLEFCRKHKAKLIYAGSSTKFGDIGEDSSPYTFTKATNTRLVINYGKWYKLNHAIVYFYNVYGGREISTGKYATLIAKFKEKTRNGETLSVVLPGTQKRNFTHIDDIINGLVLVGEKGRGDGYGIGNSQAFSVTEVAKMFTTKFVFIPTRPGNRMSGELVTKKTEALGWKATINIEDYIQENKCIS